MERIVLGYDGSSASASALGWVAARARRRSTAVGIVNVASRLGGDRAATLDRLAEAEALLRDQAPGVGVELHRLEGSTAEALSDFAGSADLLVVGINPGHPIRSAIAGAIPLRVTTHSRVPVAVIPAGWVGGDEPVTVGIAADESSAAALAFGVREARETATALRLVHSWLMPTPMFSRSTVLIQTLESEMAEHRQVLDDALSRVLDRDATMEVETELIRDSRAAALLRFAGRTSMLVIGTHHRGMLAGGLLGSVAQEVLWHTECPVAVVPVEARIPHSDGEERALGT